MTHRRRALVVATLVCCAMIVGVTGAAIAIGDDQAGFVTGPSENGPLPIPPNDFDSSERLVLSDPDPTPAQADISMDPTVATGTSFARLEAEYNEVTLGAEMRAADSSQGEVAVVRERLDDIEAQVVEDLAYEQELYQALHAGEISGDTFYRELSMLHIRADVAEEELDALSNALRGVVAPVTRDDAQRLRGEVSQIQLEARTLQGPLTEQGVNVLMTDAQSMSTVDIRASESGYVLAAVHDGVYYRQSLASENRERGSGAGFSDIEGARALTADLYPWTTAEAFESEDIPRGEIYFSNIDHPHGTTGIFIDGSTERPFRDSHSLDLFSMPTISAIDETVEGYSLVVERTYSGGPTQVTVLDAETSNPVSEASVLIGERGVGQTGQSGDLWFVAPDETFNVTIETDEANMTRRVDVSG